MKTPFFDSERILKCSRIRLSYFAVAIFFYFLTETGRFIYRPYIYRTGINDFGFADIVGNLFGTVTIIFAELAITHATRKQGIRFTILITIGITLYELVQYILPRGVFDWKDVIATPIAGFMAMGIFSLILKKIDKDQ